MHLSSFLAVIVCIFYFLKYEVGILNYEVGIWNYEVGIWNYDVSPLARLKV